MSPVAVEPEPVHVKQLSSNTHKVDDFDKTTVTPEQIVDSLKRNGGVIVRGFVNSDDLKQIVDDVRPHIELDQSWEGDFFPSETRRVTGMSDKSPTFIKAITMDPLWHSVVDAMLTCKHSSFDCKGKEHISVAKPQVSATIAFHIGPGARNQMLHRDDGNWHNVVPAITADKYNPGRDMGMSIFIAGKKSTKQNGATRFVPGSHLTHSHTPPPDEDINPGAATYAELEPGDAFMMMSSCYHGGSANKTENEERLVFASFAIKGFLRQEENQYLVTDKEKLFKTYDENTIKALGYAVAEPYTGWVDFCEPYLLLKDGKKRYTDLSGAVAESGVEITAA